MYTRPYRRAIHVLVATAMAVAVAGGCSSDRGVDVADCAASNTVPATAQSATPSVASRDLSRQPETATGYRPGMTAVRTATYAVVTANPVATEAACVVLGSGGTAADAVVTAQAVLGLVEPQASGIGGGGVMMYYDSTTRSVQAYDGREVAPKAATENYLRWIDDTTQADGADHSMPRPDTRASGRSIGVPGILRMLDLAHREHGKRAWHSLFDSAVDLASNGFRISPRMAVNIAANTRAIAVDPELRGYLLNADGTPKPAGVIVTNPAMAKTLGVIAVDGADALYRGQLAQDIVAAANAGDGGRTPARLTVDDLAGYQAKKRTPVCSDYRDHRLCGMPNPSSGGITVASTMGILENFDLHSLAPHSIDSNGGTPQAQAVHLISEAERLAYADRDRYIGDSDFVPLPGNSPDAMLDKGYLARRAALIDPHRAMGVAQPGDFGAGYGPAEPPSREHGTSHISVVDKYGNAAALTTTVESAFGSFHMVDGFLLNNQLTDFAAQPDGPDGLPRANRIQPGKRPRSSMAPTLVFDRRADAAGPILRYVVGSPGGGTIPQYVVKALVAMLDWGLDPQQAAGAVDFGADNSPVTNVGGEHPAVDPRADGADDPLVTQLRALGHKVSVAPQSSGLALLRRERDGWIGGADPRREGTVGGDRPHPS